jgi:hypothetical protein
MMTGALTSLIVFFLAMALGVVALVLGGILALSYVGGWGALARTYASAEQPNKGALLEEQFQRKAWVGLSRFGTLVMVRCFERGLELTVSFPFSPPLFFPWDEIYDYERVAVIPFPAADQFTVGNRRIRLSNHLAELEKRKALGR